MEPTNGDTAEPERTLGMEFVRKDFVRKDKEKFGE